jgi:uncharacterized OB-fold protein
MLPPRPTDRFALPRCEDCGKFHFYPRPACPLCGGARLAWSEPSGRGEVYSHSTVHRAPSDAFKADVPYVIAIVKTDEGPHLLSRVVSVSPEKVVIGMRLRVRLGAGGPEFEPET